VQALSEKRRRRRSNTGNAKGVTTIASPEAIKRRRDTRRTTKEPWDLIAQAEALIERSDGVFRYMRWDPDQDRRPDQGPDTNKAMGGCSRCG
jgi:hypothetical protein